MLQYDDTNDVNSSLIFIFLFQVEEVGYTIKNNNIKFCFINKIVNNNINRFILSFCFDMKE